MSKKPQQPEEVKKFKDRDDLVQSDPASVFLSALLILQQENEDDDPF